MTAFPALNIKGIARVSLVSREPKAMEAESTAIFNGIRFARVEADRSADLITEATVCDMHKTLFYLVLSPSGHVMPIWKERLQQMDTEQ